MAMDEGLKLYLKSVNSRLERMEDALDRVETALITKIEELDHDISVIKESRAKEAGKIMALTLVIGASFQILIALAPYAISFFTKHN